MNETKTSWKVPDIEGTSRYFDENARFYNTHRDQRRYGLKYVPPPKAENLQQLLEERLLYEQSGVKNYLLNSRYVRQKSREHERALSSARTQSGRPDGRNAKLIDQLNKDKKSIAAANPNKLRDSVFDKASMKSMQARSRTTEGLKDYGDSSQLKRSRVLKLGGGKYYFPKRQRFNENLQAEVESIKSTTNDKQNQSVKLAKLIE